jgi:hypothetical protein
MGLVGEEVEVTGTVRELKDGVAVVDSEARQAGRRIIRNGLAELALD